MRLFLKNPDWINSKLSWFWCWNKLTQAIKLAHVCPLLVFCSLAMFDLFPSKKKKKERKEKNDDEIVGASMKLSHEIINLLLLCKQKSS